MRLPYSNGSPAVSGRGNEAAGLKPGSNIASTYANDRRPPKREYAETGDGKNYHRLNNRCRNIREVEAAVEAQRTKTVVSSRRLFS